ncbi:MAG: 50S ribosomal protein L10 [Parcubacteria group bacterium]|nr:50S ribosomal protein L10 [Parcubacteria group bacterium]
MAKSKAKKTEETKGLSELLSHAKSVVFTDYQGLSVKDSTELRRLLKREGAQFVVTKNRLLMRALAEVKPQTKIPEFTGFTAVAIGITDEITPAKVVATFAKTHEKIKIKGGLLGDLLIENAEISMLASLPGKQELLARLVGTIAAPLSSMVNVLAAPTRSLLNVLNAVGAK